MRERERERERERKQVGSQGVSRIEMLTRSILSHAKYGKVLYAYSHDIVCMLYKGVLIVLQLPNKDNVQGHQKKKNTILASSSDTKYDKAARG